MKERQPPFVFQPFSAKQRALILAPQPGGEAAGRDLLLIDGAIRSGKTIACICAFVLWSARFSGENFILAGKTLGSLRRNVLLPMLRILTAFDVAYAYHQTEHRLRFAGNTYYLFGADNERAQERLQGLTAAGALADEAALFPRGFVEQMIGRCSVEGAKVLMNCNPAGPQHYLKTEYIDKAKEKGVYRLHFTLEDNPSLSPSVRARYERMFSGVFYRRFVLGEWAQAEGLIYDMFAEQRHVVATLPDRYSDFVVSCDYGTQNATVFLLWGNADGVWYALREYYYSGRDSDAQKTDGQYLRDLLDFVEGTRVSRVVVDPSAASFIALLRQATPLCVLKARNDVLGGIRAVGRALEEDRLRFSDTLTQTLREFGSYRWDTRAVQAGEDRPVKEDDHAMDAVRYFVATVLRSRGVRLLTEAQ